MQPEKMILYLFLGGRGELTLLDKSVLHKSWDAIAENKIAKKY